MSSRSRALFFAAALLWSVNLGAQAIKTITVDTPGPLLANHSYDVKIAATTDSGAAATSKKIKVTVRSGLDAQVKKKEDLEAALAASTTATTGSDGTAQITLKTKANTDVVLDAVPLDDQDHELADAKTSLEWRSILKFSVESKTGPLTSRKVYPGGIVITAKGKDDQPAARQKMRVRVIGDSDARVFVESDKPRTAEISMVVTDAGGEALVSLETGEKLDPEIVVIPLTAADEEIHLGERTVKLSALRQFDTFHSRRVFTELFAGATFTNDYDTNGKGTGFNQTGPLVRVTFDTVWYSPTRGEMEPDPKKPGSRAVRTGVIHNSLLHTGIDMEVSSFPFGEEAKNSGDGLTKIAADDAGDTPGPKGLENAFSGTVFGIWQPDRWPWASYTPTSELAGFPTDALRLGILAKVGVTTRPNAASNGDTSFWRGQLGLRFTQHQTRVGVAGSEQDNIVPIRFVEVSYGRFEEFANQVNANRLVIDAGVRLPGMGSDAIPFYAGIHLNAGRGADDLRIFAGFLFKINELATLFQKAGVQPQE